jgi:hypothetical protein
MSNCRMKIKQIQKQCVTMDNRLCATTEKMLRLIVSF